MRRNITEGSSLSRDSVCLSVSGPFRERVLFVAEKGRRGEDWGLLDRATLRPIRQAHGLRRAQGAPMARGRGLGDDCGGP